MLRTTRLFAAFALMLLLVGCKEDLYTRLDERQANEMLAILVSEGIPATRVVADDSTMTLRVDEADMARAINLLKSRGYPREGYASMVDMFADSGLITSPTEERAKLTFALSQELSRTISTISGVVDARVHVVIPEAQPLTAQRASASASVFIRHREDADLRTRLPQIKQLVANSIEGLTYDQVSLSLFPEPVRTEPQSVGSPYEVVYGLWVHPESARHARWALSALLLLGLAASGYAGYLFWQQRGAASGASTRPRDLNA